MRPIYTDDCKHVPKVTSILCFIVKVLISATTAFVGFQWIEQSDALEGEVVYSGAVVVFLALFSYFIADTFTDLFDMVSAGSVITHVPDLLHTCRICCTRAGSFMHTCRLCYTYRVHALAHTHHAPRTTHHPPRTMHPPHTPFLCKDL